MNIHEYQAKLLLSKFGVKIPNGFLANTVEEAMQVANKLSNPLVVKAQVHAGGRGKAGGVKVVKTVDELKEAAQKILGMRLVTPQTGSEGKIVHKLYIEEASAIKRELYLSLVLDRLTASVTIIASQEGGMEIEEIAHKSPEKIIKIIVDPTIGLYDFHIRKLIYTLDIPKEQQQAFAYLIRHLYKVFVDTDASQLEINPLIVNDKEEFIPLDAKFTFDDSGLFRHPDIMEMRDPLEDDELEVRAAKSGLSYVKMDGSIGCMVNGAGLAMATMDIIKLHGGSPANFLDVGGDASVEKVSEAFKIITTDKNVKAILINIFGGIMRCNIIVEGVIKATQSIGLNIPVVVRLAGTNAELGQNMLNESGLNLYSENDMEKAAKKVVELAKK